jgi:putative ABC transport system substrate-binding protein
MITRRTVLLSIACLLADPLGAQAQRGDKVRRVGFLLGATSSSPSAQIEPFKQSLRERGWLEGQNLTFAYRYADGHYERLPALTRELLDLGVDVIVTDGTANARRHAGDQDGADRHGHDRRPGWLGHCQ